MRRILIIGAGKSSISLIDYLAEHAGRESWQITVADISEELALQKTKNRPHTFAQAINLDDKAARLHLIADADIVISMLPAALHLLIAEDCLILRKHLVTPSYISPAMKALDAAVRSQGLIFMNEMGLDPGIDHMSAMRLIDELKKEGAQILTFRSHCGGLVAPESDNNAWHYKFSWNPRNVILAGQGDGGIRWREDAQIKEISYDDLFSNTRLIDLEENGLFESYPNRDSLKYAKEYGLEDIDTIYRGTLRIPPFCEAWQCLIRLGLTAASGTYRFLSREDAMKLLKLEDRPEILHMLDETGIFTRENFKTKLSPAENLQKLLEGHWKMQTSDRDLVVMVHEIAFRRENVIRKVLSSLYLKGQDSEHTAMALTVGLPLAIVTKLILNGNINRPGVHMPIYEEIYLPVISELQEYGIVFRETYA